MVCGSKKDKRKGYLKVYKNIIQNYNGKLFLVRPEGGKFSGSQIYTSVSNILEEVDLAIISLPATQLLSTLRECGEQGIKAIVILSTSASSKPISNLLRQKITAIGSRYGLQIIGPRSAGFCDSVNGVCPSLFGSIGQGSFSLISQSVHRTTEILKIFKKEKLGFSKILTLGERAGLTENELLLFLDQDKHTKFIILCLENLADERNFLRIIKHILKRKVILVLPTGSVKGGRFAKSKSYLQLVERGVLTAHSLSEFQKLIQALSLASRIKK